MGNVNITKKKSHKFVYGLICPSLLSITNFLLWLSNLISANSLLTIFMLQYPNIYLLPSNSRVPSLIPAVKSLQSCPTLCDPINGSPPGSPIPRILQARALEWVTISFSP